MPRSSKSMDPTRALDPLAAPGRLVREDVERAGFCIIPAVLANGEVDALLQALDEAQGAGGARRHSGELFAIRNLLRDVPAVRAIAASSAVRAIVEPVLGTG